LDAAFKPLVLGTRAWPTESYRVHDGFVVSFSIGTKEGTFRDKVYVERRRGRWRCRSDRFTPASILAAVVRPPRRIVIVTVADEATAKSIVRSVRLESVHVEIKTQK